MGPAGSIPSPWVNSLPHQVISVESPVWIRRVWIRRNASSLEPLCGFAVVEILAVKRLCGFAVISDIRILMIGLAQKDILSAPHGQPYQ